MKLKSDDISSADNQPADWSEPKRILHKISEKSHDLSLGQVGYWLRKTKNITGKVFKDQILFLFCQTAKFR